jgi:osmotically-inducible protein OsmY
MGELQVREDIIDELEFEPSVDSAHIGVAVDAGVVTLSGHVGSYAEKISAVAAVRRISGVRGIADEIQVRYPSDKKVADDEIAKRAVDILGWDVRVPSRSIQVVVSRGVVTLTGEVDWYYQRNAAEQDIQKLSGVHAIINNIEIRSRAKAEDIRKKIEAALKRRAEVEARELRINVRNNDTVVLEGSIANWGERFAIRTAAWSVPGVKAVEDHLTVG